MKTQEELQTAIAKRLCVLMDDQWKLGRTLYMAEAAEIMKLVEAAKKPC